MNWETIETFYHIPGTQTLHICDDCHTLCQGYDFVEKEGTAYPKDYYSICDYCKEKESN